MVEEQRHAQRLEPQKFCFRGPKMGNMVRNCIFQITRQGMGIMKERFRTITTLT